VESPLVNSLWESGDEDGTTPLSPEDRKCLIPGHITLRSELNAAEARGIARAMTWAHSVRRSTRTVLAEAFIRRLHGRMLDEVWTWAGAYRSRELNLGVAPHLIREEVRKLLGDAHYWVKHKTYPVDEIAVRFHHRLVLIHPFTNGNGRLCRLMANLIAASLEAPNFTWGRETFGRGARQQYLDALRAADRGDHTALLTMSRLP
jgi:Fic-DOC domain mobile mystery protein B